MNLLAICAKDYDATSHYRGIVPLYALQKHYPGRLFVENAGSNFDWSANSLQHADMIFFQRPHSEQHLQIAHCASQLGIPIWVDHDDFVLGLHEGHPAKPFWDASNVQLTFTQIIGLADHLSVTTDALADEYQKYTKEGCTTHVIPNAFHDGLFLNKKIWPPRRAPNPVVLWRGSPTHEPDLVGLENVLPAIAERHPDWKWAFYGYKPFFLAARMPASSCIYFPWKDGVHNYLADLNRIQPNLVIVPLADNTFNRCKSNIAWMEGVYANAAIIAPAKLPEWNRPGVLKFVSQEDFGRVLEDAMSRPDLDQVAQAGWDYVREKLPLTKINRMRAQILGLEDEAVAVS